MANKLEFAKIKLHEIVKISKINTSILPVRNNFVKNISMSNGSFYAGYKYGEKMFSVEIAIPSKTKQKLEETVRQLAYVLDITKPSPLIINNSDIVYYAVIEGETNLNTLYTTGEATLNFICYDPIGYSKDYSGITMNNNKIFNFTNMGSYNSYPIFGFKFKKPSTFLFLTNEKGESLMVGQQYDGTIPTKPATTYLINDDCQDSSTFLQGGNNVVSANRVVDGNYGVGNNGLSIVATSYGTDVKDKWVGPTFRRNIGKSLEQFEVRVNMSFSSQGKNFSEPNPKDLVRVAKKSGLLLYKEENPNSAVVGIVPYGTQLNVIRFGVAGYHLAYVKYEGKYGWLDTDFLWRININSPTRQSRSVDEMEYAEDQMGLMEVIGYDDVGQLLFRFHLRDNNKYFEHVIPEVYIREKLMLHSSTTIPTPNTINEKDDSGKMTSIQPIQSGVFGDWNDYTGTFTIRRKKLENGKYRWWAKITRTEDGVNVSQEIHMGAGVIDDSLPKGKLNNLVFYIAKYDSTPEVSVMAVNHVKVIDISNEDGNNTEEVNLEIFKEGDLLEIDCEKCEVTLNGESYIHKLDIGSQFFSVEKNSRVLARSDDENVVGTCSYRKRYI